MGWDGVGKKGEGDKDVGWMKSQSKSKSKKEHGE